MNTNVHCVRTERQLALIFTCSVSGHILQQYADMTGMYGPSKHGVTAYTNALRLELADMDSKIKVSVCIIFDKI